MALATEHNVLDERRFSCPDRATLLSRLTMSQKFAVNSLSQYGYDIAFIRRIDGHNTAIMLNGNSAATINDNGDIDTNPNIHIRT